MHAPPLRWEVGPVARIVLCRPDQQNAMTAEMGELMLRAVAELDAAAAPRVVLIEGEGRAFSAGGDFDVIAENAARTPEENRAGMLRFYGAFLSVTRLRVPTIAVIHGAAVGAGLGLAMACDLRLAAREAKLGANFVRVGLHPGMGASLLLPRLVGAAKAAELILEGGLITGEEAERIGLVNAAVPRSELRALVDAHTARITSAAPIAVMQAKATLAAPLRRELDQALAHEAAAQALGFATRDLREAVAAFREARAPRFEGK